jgi:DNA-binding transcriptional MerR regulator
MRGQGAEQGRQLFPDYRRAAASRQSNSSKLMPASPSNEKDAEPGEYSISELAREFDVTPRAIRFYEAEGLLSPAREGQRRIYSLRDRTRLKLTLRGKRLGLSLSEIREIVDMYEPGRDERPQLEKFLAVLEAHKRQLEQQREDIEAQLSEIVLFEKRCRKRLAGEKKAAKPRRASS